MTRPVIRLKSGDDRAIRVSVLSEGVPRDLTGEIVEFRASLNLDAGSSLLTKQDGDGIAVINAAGGIVDIVFRPSDTSNPTFPPVALWDLAVIAATGARETLDFSAVGDTQPQTFGLLIVERPLVAI